jgi:hypothetical protein
MMVRQNQPLPPVPPSREQKQPSTSPRPQHLLTKSPQQNGGVPPQPKPRFVKFVARSCML